MLTAEFFPLGIGIPALSTSKVMFEVNVLSTQFIELFEAKGASAPAAAFCAVRLAEQKNFGLL